ncbi:MAG: UDP-N-acetylmuramoyl-L-alanyl-D-glutamate--2,6-diaminopimelate ligase [Actinomycetia bacterium]|nr:UDP-N-acetylmuramoyl-L-alanyl-D-glutamate--2,6-diaminopimelate ligase [Actinomycetes bacterium]
MEIIQHGPPLFTVAPGPRLVLAPDVRHVTAHSGRVRPGSLFVAIPGHRTDGTRYAAEALARGAVGLVGPRGFRAPIPRWVETSNPRLLYGHLAAAVAPAVQDRLTVAAVTGTNGKTTVVEWAAHLLRAAGIPAATVGTLTDPARTGGLTTPAAEDLHALLADQAAAGTRVVLVEASSHALAQHRLAGTRIAWALVTTLGRDHLDYHRGLAAYWSAKRRLVKTPCDPWFVRPETGVLLPGAPHLPETPDAGLADRAVWDTFARHAAVPVLRYGGPDGYAAVRARGTRRRGLVAQVTLGPHRATMPLPLGDDTLVPCLEAALALARALGADERALLAALPSLPPVPGRQEWYRLPGGPYLLVDYAHNPEALEHVLRAVRRTLPGARVTAVFGGRGRRDRGKLAAMGHVAARWAHDLVATADSPYDEDPAELADAILAGTHAAGLSGRYVPERFTAILAAAWAAGPGDVVVVTGRGHETVQWGRDGPRVIGSDGEWIRRVLGAERVRFPGEARSPAPSATVRSSGGRRRR